MFGGEPAIEYTEGEIQYSANETYVMLQTSVTSLKNKTR